MADRAVHRVAADQHHLVFEVGPHEEQRGDVVLLQRDLRDDRTTTLARGVAHDRGLASTAGGVIYADADGGRRLMAVAHDRSKRIALSRSLVAPIAARGEIVAWAEEEHGRQRVIVRDTTSGAEWLAADLPRCQQGSCYQVDRLTLADRGVVFTRVASGPDMSRVVRRDYRDARISEVIISDDPQPELVPSSAGALYYAFGRGWYRWDFGQARPRPARPPAMSLPQLLGYERRHWFVLTQRGCQFGVIARRRSGRRTVVTSPRRLRPLAASHHPICVELATIAWTGRQLLTAWALAPQEALEAHLDEGLVGVVHVGQTLR